MITPPSIQQGDTLAVIAPAGMVNRAKVESAIELIEQRGYSVIKGEHLFNQHHRFAGTEDQRIADFESALRNPDVRGILSARGGYGMVRILDRLNPELFRNNPKWIVGYSDITFLHAWLQHHVEMKSIHGSLAVNFETNTESALDSLFQSMSGIPVDVSSGAHKLQRAGQTTGRLVGGNLSIIQALQGMPEQFDFTGNILLVEEVAEYPYHVDRMMWNLKRSGVLSQISGLIVGGFSSMQVNDPPFGRTSEEIIHDLVREYDYPVAMGMPIGHIDDNHAVVIGGEYSLSVDGDGAGLVRSNV